MEWEVEVMAWEEVLEWVVAMAWGEVDMEWEDLQGVSEAPALEAWSVVLETGSAWNVKISTSHGATSATNVRRQKVTQSPSNLGGGAMGAREEVQEVHQRRGLEIGTAQSRFPTFQSFCQFGFQVRQPELLEQDQVQWYSSQRRSLSSCTSRVREVWGCSGPVKDDAQGGRLELLQMWKC